MRTISALSLSRAAAGVPAKRNNDMAILNGMQLADRLPKGMLYKVVGK